MWGDNEVIDELKDREAEIRRNRESMMDPKERAEREEAAQSYLGENEKHFVDYLHDCVDTSIKETRETRRIWSECWRMFKEQEPESYKYKEKWQSRTIIPKPFTSVMYGAAAVKKAFSPDFLSIVGEPDPLAAVFWRSVLKRQLDKSHAKFTAKLVDASVMGLAVGQSMEMVPRYDSVHGLSVDLIEPWKIVRDPDAPPRDPQGGLYWIHREWLDYHVLLAGQRSGKYRDVARVRDVGQENPDDPMMTKEAIAKRKGHIYHRSSFRKMYLTSEFWGTILAPNGEVLLENGTYTVSAGRVIEPPRSSPYKRLRWPGVSFSPIPDILTHGGRGLLEGVRRLWEAMNNLMCMHEDALQYLVNPPTEINVRALVDPEDVEDFPGKKYLTRGTVSGQQVVRTVDRRDVTGSVLANMQYYDQGFQRGSMITDTVQGLPGYRAEVTAFEVAQMLDQSMGVFGLMGSNIEQGTVEVLKAIVDVLETFALPHELVASVENPDVQAELISSGVIAHPPRLSGDFSISGMQELLKQTDTLRHLVTVVFPMAASPFWGPYFRPYKALKAFEARTNLKDEDLLVDQQTADNIDRMRMAGAAGGEPQPPDGAPGEQPQPGASAEMPGQAAEEPLPAANTV